MNQRTQPLTVALWEGEAFVFFARIVALSGSNVTQASLSSISCSVYDVTGGASDLVATTSVTISSAVYDTLQTNDSRWTKDSTGYNFAYTVAGSNFPDGGSKYRVEITLLATSGHSMFLVAEATTAELLSG